jgi:hypothetical protein
MALGQTGVRLVVATPLVLALAPPRALRYHGADI